MPGEPEPLLYVAARRALLDALQALAPHLDALVLVGAQAVYLHAGEADLAVAPYTTDADLALEPARLGPEPRLEEALRGCSASICWCLKRWVGRGGGNPAQRIETLTLASK